MDDGQQVEDLTLEPVSVVRPPRPRALWGVLAALGLAAGALVVTATGGDGTSAPGLPVAFGSTLERSAGAMAADAMMAQVTYVAGDALPALGGEAPAYRLRGGVDEAQVRALADVLGLSGEITQDGPNWNLTGDGGTLGVYDGGGAQWWYSSTTFTQPVGGSGSSSGSSGSAVACPEALPAPDGSIEVGDCTKVDCPPNAECYPPSLPPETAPGPPESEILCVPSAGATCPDDAIGEPPVPGEPPTTLPPADLPSSDEARAKALDLLAATGVVVDGADVTVDGPYDAWYVTVELRLDGVPSGLLASASIGPKGVVTAAGGFLIAPERLGEYPVLDTRAAIDRANAQPMIGPAYRGGVGIEASVGVAADSCTEQSDASGSCAVEVSCPEGSDCTDPGIAVGEPTTTVVPPCAVQPDGTEICTDPELTCEEAIATSDVPLGAPVTAECVPPDPVPDPLPEPDFEPIEVVLVDAVPTLVMLGAVDGSTDLYLVPGYRFTDADGGQVDLPAVADEALVSPATTNSSAITLIGPPVTDIAVPPPTDPDPVPLPAGEQPQLGVGYYVDVLVLSHCNFISVDLGGRWWWADGISTDELAGWSQPTEGGTLTLQSEDRAEFVGDAQRTKVAKLVPYGDGASAPLCE